MTPAERWAHVQSVFHRALESAAADRMAIVHAACGGDATLREEVLSLLAAHDSAGTFLDRAEPAESPALPDGAGLLAPGTRLGAYEIESHIASGGMGDVYRGRDTRLARIVAIKVLAATQWTPDGRARFEREARAIATLSHPHICPLYDVGVLRPVGAAAQPCPFLVMPLLDGETLESRLRKGHLPIPAALEYAAQIVDALCHAHRAGLIHRDLKPANVFLTASGVNLLDFGLARDGGPAAPVEPMPERITAPRTILGTPEYMAPEQIEDRPVDGRTDVFAFGVLLYEMLGGRRAFAGDTTARVLAAVLERNPPALALLRPEVSPMVAHVVERCLEKQPGERWQTAEDLARELAWATRMSCAPPASRRRLPMWIPAVAMVALVTMTVAAAWLAWRQDSTADLPMNAAVVLPAGTRLAGPDAIAVAPDGRHFVCALAADGGLSQLYLRSLGADAMQPLPGTEAAVEPFWSPDGAAVGFFARDRLMRLDLATRTTSILAEDAPGAGGTWSANGTIVFAPRFGGSALWKVSADGGSPTPLTHLGPRETNHLWPRFLPGGNRLLFLVLGRESSDPSGIYVADLRGGAPHLVVEAPAQAERRGRPDLPLRAYYASARLIVLRGGEASAQPFDPDRLVLSGVPAHLVSRVSRQVVGPAEFDVADSLLVFGSQAEPPLKRLVWLNRAGRQETAIGAPAAYGELALSPDGKNLIAQHDDGVIRTLNRLDLQLGTSTQLTLTTDDMGAVWSPDGHHFVYGSARRGPPALFERTLDDAATERRLTQAPAADVPTSWSADSRLILYDSFEGNTDIWAVDPRDPATRHAVLQSPFNEYGAQLSPDGRWIAYVSDASGQPEIYLAPFPAVHPQLRISPAGGRRPRWRRDGGELFYISADRQLMAVGMERVPVPRARAAMPMFSLPANVDTFEVSPDGRRILLAVPLPSASPAPLTIVRNWAATLRR